MAHLCVFHVPRGVSARTAARYSRLVHWGAASMLFCRDGYRREFQCRYHTSWHLGVFGGPAQCVRKGLSVLGMKCGGIAAGGPRPMLLPNLLAHGLLLRVRAPFGEFRYCHLCGYSTARATSRFTALRQGGRIRIIMSPATITSRAVRHPHGRIRPP